jgi:hypothetical protein
MSKSTSRFPQGEGEMSEQDGSAGPIDVDDDELIDVLDAEDEDLDDENFDLDGALDFGDHVVVQQFEPDAIDVDDAGGTAFDVDDDIGDDLLGDDPVTDVGDEFLDEDPPADAGDDLLGDDPVPGAAATALPAGLTEERLARLEAAARVLTEVELGREQGRVRRKVTAATSGAGAVGFIPILLQLVGALELEPELAATSSTVAAIVGALGAGWLTPERESAVAATPAAQELLDEEPDPAPQRARRDRPRGRRARRARAGKASGGRRPRRS